MNPELAVALSPLQAYENLPSGEGSIPGPHFGAMPAAEG